MSKSIKYIIWVALVLMSSPSFTQTSDDLTFVASLTEIQQKPSAYATFKEHISNNSNEVEAVVSGLFLIYKEFFSSQDANRCAFYPSCSLYSILSIKNKGLVKGGIMTFDRLTRCNGLSPEKYEADYKSRSYLDPVNW
jgi:uncharacterized protein